VSSEALYRRLLAAYPLRYRREYEEAMAQCFRDQLRAANTSGKRILLWLCSLIDLTLTVPARHLEYILPLCRGRLSNSGSNALFFARFEASSYNCSEIRLEHLLLGALRDHHQGLIGLLGSGGVEEIVRAVEASEKSVRRIPAREDLPLSQECKVAITRAIQQAGSGAKMNTGHILAAILHQQTSAAVRLLQQRGLDLRALESLRRVHPESD